NDQLITSVDAVSDQPGLVLLDHHLYGPFLPLQFSHFAWSAWYFAFSRSYSASYSRSGQEDVQDRGQLARLRHVDAPIANASCSLTTSAAIRSFWRDRSRGDIRSVSSIRVRSPRGASPGIVSSGSSRPSFTFGTRLDRRRDYLITPSSAPITSFTPPTTPNP